MIVNSQTTLKVIHTQHLIQDITGYAFRPKLSYHQAFDHEH
jgi:hypothetical protein